MYGTPEINILHLYKYQPLIEIDDDHVDKQWHQRLKKTLQQELWLHPLADFNDPFERHFKYISDPDKAIHDDRLFSHLHEYYKLDTGLLISANEFKEILKSPEFRTRVKLASESWMNGSFHKTGPFSQHGTYCFTDDDSNIPMWAHYANNHRGYCIIFELDFSEIFKLIKMPAGDQTSYIQKIIEGGEILTFHLANRKITFAFTKVIYSETPPVMELDKFLDLNHSPYLSIKYLVSHSIGVKYYQWRYENEYRLIANINSKDSGFLNLGKLLPFIKVSGIIMGSQLTESEKKVFHDLCNEYKICLFQAKCSETNYRIDRELVDDYS